MKALSARRAPQFIVMILKAVLLISSTAAAQDSNWAIQADAPDGYSSTGGQTRRVFNRRFSDTRERNRIELSIQEYAAESVEAFLKAQVQSREQADPSSSRAAEVAGRAGKSIDFTGTYEFRGKIFNTRRRVSAFWVSKGVFMRISSLLVFPDKEPSDELTKTSERAIKGLMTGIKLTLDGNDVPVNKTNTGAAETEKTAPSNQTKTYSNSTTIPFSFEYPGDWYVGSEELQAPGSLWVIATPFSEQAVYAPLDQLEAALRVNVIGFVPELFGAADSLVLATKVAGQRFDGNEDYVVSIEKSGLLGSANGQLMRYAPKRGKKGTAGQILVVTVDSSLLIAEFSWPSEKTAEYEEAALKILTSFKIEFDRRVETITEDGVAFDYAPSIWTVEEVATSDRSRAWNLETSGTELFIRSMPLAKGAKVSAATLKRTCELLLGRELALASTEVLSDSSVFRMPRAGATWRCFFFHEDRAKEAYAMVRDGALHLAVLTSDKGVRGFHVAQALTVFASLKGPAFSGQARTSGKDLLKKPCRFTSIRTEAFEIDGTFTGQLRISLDFKPDGSVRMSPGPDENGAAIGSYGIEPAGVSLKFEGKPAMRLRWTPDGRGLQGTDGRLWHLASGM